MSRLCPKCHQPARAGAEACSRCGLSIFRWETYGAEPLPDDPVLGPLWAELAGRWQEAAAHERFLEAAVAAGALDLAAARYRAHLAEHGADPMAEAALARAAVYVERLHAIRAEADSRPQVTARLLRGLALVVALLLVGAVLWLLAGVLGLGRGR